MAGMQYTDKNQSHFSMEYGTVIGWHRSTIQYTDIFGFYRIGSRLNALHYTSRVQFANGNKKKIRQKTSTTTKRHVNAE